MLLDPLACRWIFQRRPGMDDLPVERLRTQGRPGSWSATHMLSREQACQQTVCQDQQEKPAPQEWTGAAHRWAAPAYGLGERSRDLFYFPGKAVHIRVALRRLGVLCHAQRLPEGGACSAVSACCSQFCARCAS